MVHKVDVKLWFNIQLDTKQVISKTFFPQLSIVLKKLTTLCLKKRH